MRLLSLNQKMKNVFLKTAGNKNKREFLPFGKSSRHVLCAE